MIKALHKHLLKLEGKKHQVNAADMSEILGHVADSIVANPKHLLALLVHGMMRAQKAAKAKGKKK